MSCRTLLTCFSVTFRFFFANGHHLPSRLFQETPITHSLHAGISRAKAKRHFGERLRRYELPHLGLPILAKRSRQEVHEPVLTRRMKREKRLRLIRKAELMSYVTEDGDAHGKLGIAELDMAIERARTAS